MVQFLRLFFILSAYLLYLALSECSVSLNRPQGMLLELTNIEMYVKKAVDRY